MGGFCRLYLHTKTTGLFMNTQDKVMIEKLERLSELYRQQWESGYTSPLREFGSKAAPTQPATELEVSEEFVASSKEVASYYEPLIERLVETGVLTVNVLEPCAGCAVFEVASVLDQRKSYFNEGKIVLLAEEEQVNGWDGKLKAEFTKRLSKFLNV